MTQERQVPEARATWINIGIIITVVLLCLVIASLIPINGNPPILCSINDNTPVIGDVICPEETLLPIDEIATLNPDNADAVNTSSPQPTVIPPTASVNTVDCLSLSFDDDFESGLSSCWETINAGLITIDDNTVIQLDGTNTTAVAEISDVRWETFCMHFLVRQVSDAGDNSGSLWFNFRISDSGDYGVLFNFDEDYVAFGKNIESEWEEISSSSDVTFEPDNGWMEVRILVAGVYYFVHVNDQDVINASDSSSITNGYLSWSVPANGGIVQIDDVRVSDTCN